MEMDEAESFSGRLRVLELYSGIGGMHWALKESGVDYDVVQAMDVNTSANAVYQHNFPHITICASSIAKLTVKQLEKWSPNTILMSPPCQPFTRVGKKQDCQDPRTQSFLHLLDLLRELDHKPEYILVENVKGFEVSETRSMLLDMLHDCKYAFQEFLLTPLQFGVPNCRMRYYLIAKLNPLEFGFWTSDKIQYDVPVEAFPWLRYRQSSEDVDGQTTTSDASSTAQCKQCPGQQAPLPPPVSTTPSHQDTVSQSSPPGSDSTTALSSHTKDTVLKTSACEAVVSVPPVLDDADQSQQTVAGCARKSSQGEALNSEFQCQCSLTSACVCDRKASLVDKAAGVCGRTAVACIENRTSWTSGNSQAGCLTIAEAGRNMRHCEEDDSLVCCDGTRLQDHLEKADGDYFQQFLLPDKELRMFVVMDVVHPSFRKSSCFTKRYGHYVEGAGSLVMMTDDVQVVKEASEFKSWAVEHKNRQQWGEAELSVLRRLNLRYFTPREVANLLCFPPEFEFPEGLSTVQCHRLLGNSLNVHVVAILIRLMLMEPGVI